MDFTPVRRKHVSSVIHMMGQRGSASADFELGLELDGAEVRGILLFEGREWGRVIFDMLS
jgi:hypothetical protein